MRERASYVQKVADKENQDKALKAEKERGFPSGVYSVRATYPHKSGETKEQYPTQNLRVEDQDTRENVLREMRSWTVMLGLHNFAMAYNEQREAEVTLDLVKDGKVYATQKVLLDPSGHVVK